MTAEQTIDVVLCDDVSQLRTLVRYAFEEEGDLRVVAEAGDGAEGVALVARHRPHAVLLDLAMPTVDGLEAIPQLRVLAPETAIVVFSGFQSSEMAEQALALGADAYVEKGAGMEEVAEVVRSCVGARRRAADAT